MSEVSRGRFYKCTSRVIDNVILPEWLLIPSSLNYQTDVEEPNHFVVSLVMLKGFEEKLQQQSVFLCFE